MAHCRRRTLTIFKFVAVVLLVENLLLLWRLNSTCTTEECFAAGLNSNSTSASRYLLNRVEDNTNAETLNTTQIATTPPTTMAHPSTPRKASINLRNPLLRKDAALKELEKKETSAKAAEKAAKKAKAAKELEEAEKKYYQRRPTKVNPYQHGFLIDGKDICDTATYLVIIVHSLHNNDQKRAAIRDTWGSVARGEPWPFRHINVTIKLAFIFGIHKELKWNERIREEESKFGDVVQGDFTEDYKNMTLKSLLELRWVHRHCSSAKYLLKSDDDMFINLPYLTELLQRDTMPPRSIMGPYNQASRIYRSGKWGVKPDAFPFANYPPYESGAAYVITSDLMEDLYETAEYVPQIHVDDVYITGILGRILNVTHVRQFGFAYATTKSVAACDFVKDKMVTGTKMKPPSLRQTWDTIKSGTCLGKP